MSDQKTFDNPSERGSVLITALLVLFASGVMGLAVVMLSSTDLKISGNQRHMTEALFTAEAGLTEAVHRLSLPVPTYVDVNGSLVNAAVADTVPYDPNWKAIIHAKAPGAEPVFTGSTLTTGTIQPPGDYLTYSQPTGTDDVITIEHKWEDRDGDGIRDADEIVLYDPFQAPSENFVRGKPIEVITVTGRVAGVRRILQADVSKTSPAPRPQAAFVAQSPVTVSGSMRLCGWNHDANIPTGSGPMGCFAYHLADEHRPGIATTGEPVEKKSGSSSIEGSPVAVDTSSANEFFTLAEVLGMSGPKLAELLANADYTSIPGGSFSGVTFITGDAVLHQGASGLLYVTGDLRMNASASFRGLLYVEGELEMSGSAWILGAAIMAGSELKATGGATFLYSQEVMEVELGFIEETVILSWREL